MPLNEGWEHTGPDKPCRACGKSKRGNRCLYNRHEEVAICYYEPSKHRRRPTTAGDSWTHFFKPREDRPRSSFKTFTVRVAKKAESPRRYDLAALAAKFQGQMTFERLDALSRQLGLSRRSLTRLDIGWSSGELMFVEKLQAERPQFAWTFPRRNAAAAIAGISMRPEQGNKYTWAGSGGGLHIPRGFAECGVAFLCEGPSDTAAALDLGLNAFGRSSCSSDVDQVIAFVQLHRIERLIIFSQLDEAHYRPKTREVYYPAQDGAKALANALALRVPDIRVIEPPAHPGHKDVRDWKNRGATAADVESRVAAASPRKMEVKAIVIGRKKRISSCQKI